MILESDIQKFRRKVYHYYSHNKRLFPWRETTDPYKILVSEVMLQQTQTTRVLVKYKSFLNTFPNITTLARASRREVLKEWIGLGYNRRALQLHEAAHIIFRNFNSLIPFQFDKLVELPGIGPATAGAICCYAFNKPRAFIETNIRTVFIYEFFKDKTNIKDTEIFPLITKTLDLSNPREWFYALTDYGVYLKKTHENYSRKSKHYTIQSKFEGSNRQKRSQILKSLVTRPQTIAMLQTDTSLSKHELEKPLEQLTKEGFILYDDGFYKLQK